MSPGETDLGHLPCLPGGDHHPALLLTIWCFHEKSPPLAALVHVLGYNRAVEVEGSLYVSFEVGTKAEVIQTTGGGIANRHPFMSES